jgi:hypothetical protein
MVTCNLARSVFTIFWQLIFINKLLQVKTVVPRGRAVQGAAHQGLELPRPRVKAIGTLIQGDEWYNTFGALSQDEALCMPMGPRARQHGV